MSMKYSSKPATLVSVVPEEEGVISEESVDFLRRYEQFVIASGIQELKRVMRDGAEFTAFFTPEDADKITAWLKGQKVILNS